MSTSFPFPNVSSPRVSAWAPSRDPRSWVQAGIALSLMLLLVAFVPLHAIAENVTLAWDSNSEPDLAGYILYHKDQASAQYLDSVVVGYMTSYTMSGLEPGNTYDFVVTAFDESGNESDFSAPVSASIPFSAPVAAFSLSATSGIAPLAVSFTDTSTGNITAWAWTFGDGATSTVQHPSHTYTLPGTYTVSLTATGPGGEDTATKPSYITVTAPVPVAGFSATTTTGVAPLAMPFTNTTTGESTAWLWTFGDGATSTVQHPSHTYTLPGTYTVSLTATGPGGEDTATKPSYISVTAPVPDSDDVVKITKIRYRRGAAKLIIHATSSEAPNATLVVEGIGEMQYNKKKQRYHLSVSPYAKPATVTVTSSLGGYDTAVVR